MGTISEAIEVTTDSNNDEVIEGFENDADFGDVQFQDDDDEDNENAISVEKLKREIMGSPDSELKNLEEAGEYPQNNCIDFFFKVAIALVLMSPTTP